MSLAERIRERLRVIDMTQADLCRSAKIPPSTLASILQRDSRTSPHLSKLAAALRTTPSWLLGDTDDIQSETADESISAEERELIGLIRQLRRQDFHAIAQLLRSLAQVISAHDYNAVEEAAGPTLHDRQLGYHAG